VTPGGVTVIGAGNLPAQMAAGASAAYARNISALLTSIIVDGEIKLDPSDEVVAAILVGPAADAETEGTVGDA